MTALGSADKVCPSPTRRHKSSYRSLLFYRSPFIIHQYNETYIVRYSVRLLSGEEYMERKREREAKLEYLVFGISVLFAIPSKGGRGVLSCKRIICYSVEGGGS